MQPLGISYHLERGYAARLLLPIVLVAIARPLLKNLRVLVPHLRSKYSSALRQSKSDEMADKGRTCCGLQAECNVTASRRRAAYRSSRLRIT